MAEPSYWSLAAGVPPADAPRLAPAPAVGAEPAFAPDEVIPEGESFTIAEQPATAGRGTAAPGEHPAAVGRVELPTPALPTDPPVIVAPPSPARERAEQSDAAPAPLPRMTHGLPNAGAREPLAPVIPRSLPPRAGAGVPEVPAPPPGPEAEPPPGPPPRSDVVLVPPVELPEDAAESPRPEADSPAAQAGLHIGKLVIELARPGPTTPERKPTRPAAPAAVAPRPPDRIARGFGAFGLHQG